MKKIYIGIDPGKSGAIAFLPSEGDPWIVRLDYTDHDIKTAFYDALRYGSEMDWKTSAVLEKVHSSPQMGVKSSFSFGQSFGKLEMLLACLQIPFEYVTPSKWQGDMKCRTKGDKNVTKAAAQRLFPSIKITHRNADALLLAEYARRKERGLL
jgi:hypothetical protein